MNGYPIGWVERQEDRRRARIVQWGAIGLPIAQRVSEETDWPYVCVQVPAVARTVYEQVCGRRQALTDVSGILDGVAFHVSRENLRRLWRADARRVA